MVTSVIAGNIKKVANEEMNTVTKRWLNSPFPIPALISSPPDELQRLSSSIFTDEGYIYICKRAVKLASRSLITYALCYLYCYETLIQIFSYPYMRIYCFVCRVWLLLLLCLRFNLFATGRGGERGVERECKGGVYVEVE